VEKAVLIMNKIFNCEVVRKKSCHLSHFDAQC